MSVLVTGEIRQIDIYFGVPFVGFQIALDGCEGDLTGPATAAQVTGCALSAMATTLPRSPSASAAAFPGEAPLIPACRACPLQ